MPDKGKMNFTDKQFADFAWSEMEQMLDKEMPVDKKRRIAVWYWIAAGVLFISALGILISQPKKNTNLITKAVPTENTNHNSNNNSSILADNKTANLSQKRATLNTKTAKNTVTANDSPKLTGNNTADLSQKRTTLNTNTTLSSTQNNSKTQTNSDVFTTNPLIAILEPNLTNVIKTNETDKNEVIEELVSIKEGISENNSLSTKEEKIASSPTAKINTLSSTIAYTELHEPLATHTTLSKKDIPSAISTSIYAKAQTTSFTEINGYEAGILLTKNINNSKWSVGAGISFTSEITQLALDTLSLGQHVLFNNSLPEQDLPLANENILFDIFPNQSFITGPGAMSTSSLSNISKVNLQLQYISLPILVSYKLNSRVNMYAGISPSVLIKSKIIFSQDYIESASLRKADDFYSINQQYLSASNTFIPLEQHALRLTSKVHAPIKIKRFKLPIHLGVNYQLTRHFGLTLDATANLQPTVNQDFIKTDFGRFKLGAYWKF